MTNNDILRSLRYALDLPDHQLVELIRQGEGQARLDEAKRWLLNETEPEYLAVNDLTMHALLDGLIVSRRGKREPPSDQPSPAVKVVSRMSNNLALKKLRIAFELKEDDLVEVFQQAGFRISRPEISALFRAPGHKNFRPCGDQVLRNFLKGLTLRVRPA